MSSKSNSNSHDKRMKSRCKGEIFFQEASKVGFKSLVTPERGVRRVIYSSKSSTRSDRRKSDRVESGDGGIGLVSSTLTISREVSIMHARPNPRNEILDVRPITGKHEANIGKRTIEYIG